MRYVKSAIDRVVASIALVLLSPLMALIACAILASMGRPVVFAQVRPGLHGKPFTIYKFRTMRNSGFRGGADSDDDRITRLGHILRKSSLDELPQLLNVLRGELSLVGPRPLLVEYLERYSPNQMRRHDVMPGITGWTQVNGRNSIEWDQKFDLDIWYVDNWSLGLDLKILFLTIGKVFRASGVSYPGRSTMIAFEQEPDSEGK